VARILRLVGSRRTVCVSASALVLLLLLPAVGVIQHIYFDRGELPDLEPFIRFELPTIGQVYDTNGKVLVELAREYRQIVPYDEVPPVLRDAILAAEDKNFFLHSGVEYRALLRVGYKAAVHSVAAWRKNGLEFRLHFPQGGSTLTQQLVRGYFLRDRVSHENGAALFRDSVTSRFLAAALGVPTTNKLLRKVEEVRLALWLEEEMRRRFGSQERAKREIFARSANLNYLGNGRYGLAASSEYYFGKPLSSYTVEDAGKAALLAAAAPPQRDPGPDGPQRLHL
jgi:penicillin-binding protein 1A